MSIFNKIFRGTVANDNTGDPLRTGGQIVNDNFDIAEAALLDRLLRVDSVEDIAGFVGDYDGQQISLLGWHPDSDIGGGILYWDSGRAKSEHNGGTIISPTVPWSSTTSDFLDGVGETDGSGTGVWVRSYFGPTVTPLMFGADSSKVKDSTASFRKPLELGFNLFIPEGAYKISDSLILSYEGQSMTGLGIQSTLLEWNGSSGEFIRMESGRSTGEGTSTTGIIVQGFEISSVSGSKFDVGIWVEAGVFHSYVRDIRARQLRGFVPDAIVKLDTDSGATYPVDVNFKNVVVTGTGNTNSSSSVIPRGFWIEGAIECTFEDCFAYSFEDCWVIGTNDNTNARVVADCLFLRCHGETGDRALASTNSTAFRLFQGFNLQFQSCKFAAGLEFSSPTDQNPIRFSGTGDKLIRNITFTGGTVWGDLGCNDLVYFDSSCNNGYRGIRFSDVEFNGSVNNIIRSETNVYPEVYLNSDDNYFIDASISSNNFKRIGFDVSAQSITGSGSYRFQNNDGFTPKKSYPCLASYTDNTKNLFLIPYQNSVVGSYRVDVTNRTGSTVLLDAGQLLIKRVDSEIISDSLSISVNPPSLVSNEQYKVSVLFPDAEIGDVFEAGFFCSATGNQQGILINAYCSTSGTVDVVFQNMTGTSINLTEGKLTICKLRNFDLFEIKSTYNPPDLAPNAFDTTNITLAGVDFGDFITASYGVDQNGVVVYPYVSAPNTVTVIFYNGSSVNVNLTQDDIKVGVYKNYSNI